MPRKRRPVRPVRRPTFQPAPEAPSEPIEDDEAPPTFADEPAVTVPAYGAGGPVETRPHWIGRDQRVQGRRLAQLRRSSGEERGAPRSSVTGMLPTFATGSITGEIRQILITTGVMVVFLIVLALVLR
jgi:hypothetical protein